MNISSQRKDICADLDRMQFRQDKRGVLWVGKF